MYYSLIGILASLLLIITNHDVFLKKNKNVSNVQKVYRYFLFSVLTYYITDIFWGTLDYFSLIDLLFIDTEIYFLAMASGILFWTKYVIAYLGEEEKFKTILSYTGRIFCCCVFGIVILNLFIPIMFWFDENGLYHSGIGRNILLITQILILFLTSYYVFRVVHKVSERKKNRYITIGSFGIIMLIFISIQFFQPLLPLYAIGYMLGNSLLRTFVIENEKEEYRQDLELALEREEKDLKELTIARRAAYTDSLTGAHSRFAYDAKEELLNQSIYNGTITPFVIAVFDINELKQVNDTLGHDAGDQMIIKAYTMIQECFKGCTVYRIGGDEFVVIIEGENFKNKEEYKEKFKKQIEENQKNKDVVLAVGYAEFDKKHDTSIRRTFIRADLTMYEEKIKLKGEDDIRLSKE